MKFTIAVDVDETINNLMTKALEMCNKETGESFTIDDLTDYDLFACLPYEYAHAMKNIFLRKELWDSLSPSEDAQWGIKKLINKGYDVYLATATDPINFHWKVEWIKHYFPFVSSDNIIRINNKGLLHVDVMVDDCADYLTSNMICYRILVNKPWNKKTYAEAYGMRRCNNWSDIVQQVDEIYEFDKGLLGG